MAPEFIGTDKEPPKRGLALPAAPFPPGCGTDMVPEATGTDIELAKKGLAVPVAPFPAWCGADMEPEATGTEMELPKTEFALPPTGTVMELLLLTGSTADTEHPDTTAGFVLNVAIPTDRANDMEGLEGAPVWYSATMEYCRDASLLVDRWGGLRVPGFDGRGLAKPFDTLRGLGTDRSGERCDNLGVRWTSTNAMLSTCEFPVNSTLGVMGGLGKVSNTTADFGVERCDITGVWWSARCVAISAE